MIYCHVLLEFSISDQCFGEYFCVNFCKQWLVMCCLCGCVGANWWSLPQCYSWLQPQVDVVALDHQYNRRMRDRWDLWYGELWIGTIVNCASTATSLDIIEMDVVNSVDKVCVMELGYIPRVWSCFVGFVLCIWVSLYQAQFSLYFH